MQYKQQFLEFPITIKSKYSPKHLFYNLNNATWTWT